MPLTKRTMEISGTLIVHATVITLLIGSMPPQAIASELQLTYEVTRKEIPKEPQNSLSSIQSKTSSKSTANNPEKTTKIIYLGPDYLCVQEADKREIFDFAKNRILTLDTSRHTYQDHSLFSIIAFRAAEIKNRTMISNIINAAGGSAEGAGFDPFSLESLFSLTGPGNTAGEVDVMDDNHQKIFKHKGKIVTRFQPSSTESGTYSEMMQKFFIYCCSLHPSIRKQIEASASVPQTLQFEVDNFPASAQTVEFRLLNKDESSVGHAAEVAPDYQQTLDNDNPMLPLLPELKKLAGKPLPTQEDAQKKAEEYLSENDFLDALLTLSELTLVSGEKVSAKTAELMRRTNSDDKCKKLVSSLIPKTEEEADTAIKTLDSLDKPDVQKAYVLNIFRANIVRSKNSTLAQTLLSEAVRRNPYLTGAYKDLGDIYYMRYDTTTAFDCWDIGRRFFPNHPMMADVNHMETSFQDTFSEYFLKKR